MSLLTIKFAAPRYKNKNDHQHTNRELLWYVVNERGEMALKPETSLPNESEFSPDFLFVGLTRLGYKEIELAPTRPNEPIKKSMVKGLVDGRVVHKFEDIDFDLLSTEPGLGRTPCEDPLFSVVVNIRGERTCWNKGIEMMYYES
jgi:hypothetical protein